MRICTVFAILSILVTFINTKCPLSVLATLEYVIEHAVWRGWQQAVIYTTDLESDCQFTFLRLVKCLSVNGIASAVNIKLKSRVDSFLGVVIFQRNLLSNSTNRFTSTINQITAFKMNTAAFDWLIVANSVREFKTITKIMNATNIRFDQNIVVALPQVERQQRIQNSPCANNFNYERRIKNKIQIRKKDYKAQSCHSEVNNGCNKTVHELNYYKTSERFKGIARYKNHKIYKQMDLGIVPLWRSSFLNNNITRNFQAIKVTNFSVNDITKKLYKHLNLYDTSFNIQIIQLFKMQQNSTVFIEFLGTWSKEQSMYLVKSPYTVETRNFMGEPITVGRCNSSIDDPTGLDEDVTATSTLLDDVLDFLTLRFNATPQTRYYSKLGYRTYEGVWTGLLGALMENSIDIALEPVTAISSTDIDFIFPIAETMCNIYIRHQETSAVRDIFLAPFSPQLIFCVVCVVLLSAITLIIISRLTLHSKCKHITCMDAIIWSTGILCQQGSSWRPYSPAASVLLIVCLFFALVTYNAYAAFITSVLSVRVANVGSLADVLKSSNIKIGYVKNGADQMFLMSTKDIQLNAFYIRGYSEAENLVSSTEEGLVRAAMLDYAFFSGQRAARTTIKSLSQARGRCALRELPISSTRAQLAFPLPSGSPYARPLLISLLQLRSGGVLARLEDVLVPSMPQCEAPSGFASARAADVRTALFVILIGLISALFLGIAEFLWRNRDKLIRKLGVTFAEIIN